ncbi:MAG: efflux RND transporter permease subunit [Candidatus Saccharimonadales bacterium]
MKKQSWQPPKWVRVLIPAVLITTWFAIAGIGGPYFGRVEEVSDVDLSAFLPKSAEATKVNEEVKKFRSEATIPAIVVFTPRDGVVDDAEKSAIDEKVPQLNDVEGVVGEVSPAIVAEDKQAALIVIQTDTKFKVSEVLEGIRKELDEPKLAAVDYKITGPAGFAADLTKAFAGIDGILLITALAVVFVILVIVYRSVLLPVIVLLTSMFALTASIFVIWNLANADVIQLNGQVQGILFILVIGAATDYSLLYIARYREELYRLESKWDATHASLRGSLEPIIASGSTVIVGLLCLLLSDLASNKALGPVGAIGIAMAMLSSLTFLPVILYALGRASFWPARPRADATARKQHEAKLKNGFWHGVGEFVSRRPRPIWIMTSLLLLAASSGYFWLKADGVEQSKLIIGTSEARDGQAILSRHFPSGSGSPVLIIGSALGHERLAELVEADKGIDGVSVTADNSPSGVKPLGKQEASIRNDIRVEVQKKYDEDLAKLDQQETDLTTQYGPYAAAAIMENIRATIPTVDSIVDTAYPFKDATAKVIDGEVLLQATLKDAPDSQAAKDTVKRLRGLVRSTDSAAMVGGPTAVQYDTNVASIHDRQLIIPIVLVAITIILMLLLRSILAPILLLLTTVISFGASLGVAAWLFNDIFKFPGADPSVILYGFVFLVALGIDYNIFLMTRVREEALRHGTQIGVIKGLVVTGGVITSAGVVLAATFAALGVIPILFLFQLAFIVAFGVLLDTIVVRSLLVPALIKDLGAIVWWPSKLHRKI